MYPVNLDNYMNFSFKSQDMLLYTIYSKNRFCNSNISHIYIISDIVEN